LVKPVFDGAHSMGKLLHLQVGQAVPVHPHAGREVVLFPQKGEAVLIGEDGAEQSLKAGTVYYQGIAPTFGLKNTGSDPFQMLVLLVRAGGEAQ
jgi:oxalate decarboxylase/phosphoglucose isomerase-like protein (cupin superfamily)